MQTGQPYTDSSSSMPSRIEGAEGRSKVSSQLYRPSLEEFHDQLAWAHVIVVGECRDEEGMLSRQSGNSTRSSGNNASHDSREALV